MAIAETARDRRHIAALAGVVEFVQLRDLSANGATLMSTAKLWKQILAGSKTKLLVNHRADIALAAGADGVHLRGHRGELGAAQVRALYRQRGLPPPIVSRSCHTLAEVQCARDERCDQILFGPVFEKRVRGEMVREGCGLDALAEACAHAGKMKVLALGGVDENNAAECVKAGAAGIAAIRLFEH